MLFRTASVPLARGPLAAAGQIPFALLPPWSSFRLPERAAAIFFPVAWLANFSIRQQDAAEQ